MAKKIRNKKYTPPGIDHLSHWERCAIISQEPFPSTLKILKEGFFISDLPDTGIILYIFTFEYDILFPDESCAPIREFLDREFELIQNANYDYIMSCKHIKTSCTQDEIDMLYELTQAMMRAILKITSRKVLAKLIRDTYVNFNIYVTAGHPNLQKWFDLINLRKKANELIPY